jgi:hypothetical protein
MYVLRTLPGLELLDGERRPAKLRPQDALVLAFLSVDRPQVPFARLLNTFWPGRDIDQAKHSFAQVIYRLNRISPEPFILRVRNTLSTNRAAIKCDYESAARALKKGDLTRALRLRRGEFLKQQDDFSSTPLLTAWIEGKRAKLEIDFERVASVQCQHFFEIEDWLALNRLTEALKRRRLSTDTWRFYWCASCLAIGGNEEEVNRELQHLSAHEQELCSRATRRAAHAVTAVHSPVGRERIFASILHSISETSARHLQLSGELGIGKTTLAEAVLGRLSEQGYKVFRVCCLPAEQTLGYAPIERLLRQLPPFRPYKPDSFAERQDAVWLQVKSELMGRLRAVAISHPVVLCFDDVQWADESTIGLLSQLIDVLPSARVRLIVIVQSAPVSPRAAALSSLAERLECITVRPLSREKAAVLAQSLLQHGLNRRARRLYRTIATKSGGQPLFVVAMCRALSNIPHALRSQALEDGMLRFVGDSLSDYVRQYTALLDEAAAHLLEVMAVFGDGLDIVAWSDLAGQRICDVRQSMISLARVHLASAVDDTWKLSHELVRNAIYETLSPSYRRALHRKVAQFLLARKSPEAVCAIHLAEAGMHERAIVAAARGGRESRQRYAFHAAAELYRIAATVASSDEQRQRLDVRQARAYIAARDWSRAAALLARLRDCPHVRSNVEAAVLRVYSEVRLSGLSTKIQTDAQSELLRSEPVRSRPALRAQLYSSLAICAVENGRHLKLLGFDHVKELIGRCRGNTDALFALLDYASAASILESVPTGLQYLQYVRNLAEETGEQHLITAVYGSLAGVNVLAGNLVEAKNYFRMHRSFAEQLGLRGALLSYWNNYGTILCELDKLMLAERYLLRARKLSGNAEYRSLYSKAVENLFIVRWEQGRFEQLLRFPQSVDTDILAAYRPCALMAVVGLANLEQGRLSVAKELSMQLTDIMRTSGPTTSDQGYPTILIARVLRLTQSPEAALERLEAIRAVCKDNRHIDYLRLTVELARQLRRLDAPRAKRYAEHAAEEANRCGAALLCRQARELLDRIP